MKKIIFVAPLFLFALAACEESGVFKEQNPPTISVTSPAEGTVYHVGDTVHIKGSFSDDTNVQTYTVDIKKVNSNNILHYTKISEADTTTIPLDSFVVIPIAMPGDYQLQLYCEDPNDNFTNKVVNFSAIP